MSCQPKHLALVLFAACIVSGPSVAQRKMADSLLNVLANTSNDTTKYIATSSLVDAYRNIDLDSGVYYAQQLILLSKRFNDPQAAAGALNMYGYSLFFAGHYPDALEVSFRALQQAELDKDSGSIASNTLLIGFVYRNSDEYQKAIHYFNKYKAIADHFNDNGMRAFFYAEAARAYEQLNSLDTALQYNQQALALSARLNTDFGHQGVFCNLGTVQSKRRQNNLAQDFFHKAISLALRREDFRTLARSYAELGKHFYKNNAVDSAIWYLRAALRIDTLHAFTVQTIDAATVLTTYFTEKAKYDSAFKYQQIMLGAKDRLFSREKLARMQNQAFNDQLYRQELAVERALFRNRLKMYGLLAALLVFLVAGALLWRNSRHQSKAKRRLEKAYKELKATQAQLIQSEKMASLGELTAGIAHEIQNPLNFVNNFAEVNTELITDLEVEVSKGNLNEVKTLAADLKSNEQKIALHGKRAESIVKNMLQHSQTSKGEKQPTDINALVDEYLRLSYHGLRAKDKSFNATLQTHFDASIGKINVVSQDISRVLLNLFNNAFYAVNERKKTAETSYEPTVSVSTHKLSNNIEIVVKDNGMGISKGVQDKIFHPFFTTKPTGQGTGLGLSLSYDIIKAHSGELQVKSIEGEGATFTLQLPA